VCGIAGVLDGRGDGHADPALVRAMTGRLVHRGPDGEGFFAWPPAAPRVALGIRRLRIIDLATGDQPIFSEDGSVAVVCNGEVYNYLELRAELEAQGHTFRTRSDTETLVHLYERDGLDLFRHLRGMYAFALWDVRAERLVLAVDHVGIKPLYLAERDGRLRFASEVKALLADPDLPRRLNPATLDTYLSFGYMIGAETLYESVRRLPAGHALVVERGGARLVRHWQLRYPAPGERTTDRRAAALELRERLGEAVRLHLRSDVPVGLFLSGGLDSATLLALMAREAPSPVRTFTVGYRTARGIALSDDERAPARRVAAHFGAEHCERVVSAADWWEALTAYAYHHDEPNANSSAVTLHALAETAARHVRVVLNGTGGDELFAGYAAHRQVPRVIRAGARLDRVLPVALRHRLVGRPWGRLEAVYPRLRRLRWLGALPAYLTAPRALFLPLDDGLRRMASFEGLVLTDVQRDRLYGAGLAAESRRAGHAARAYREILRDSAADDPADVAHALVIHTWLQGNGLLALDKVTMAHSLEARVPFFDPPLLELAARLSPGLRAGKRLLRDAMAAELPGAVLARPKRPFETPIREWFDHDLAARVRGVLLDGTTLGRGLFDRAALEALVRRHDRRQAEQTELIFRLVLLELWQRSTIDAPPHVLALR
jgi:asparagine synthase (glutamine-hydrolysing)